MPIIQALFDFLIAVFRTRLSLHLEILALRAQLAVYERSSQRPRIQASDRILWSWLSRHWSGWRETLVFVQPETVIAWQRRRFREHWARLSGVRAAGRPTVSEEVKALIRKISGANPGWGAPRIVGELHKLGIAVANRR